MLEGFKKGIAASIFSTKKEGITRLEQYPLDIRLGGRIEIVNNSNLIYDSLFKTKREGYSVSAIGKFPMSRSMIYRFYLDSSDTLCAGKTFLQIITSKDNIADIEEIRAFDLSEMIFPSTKAAWNRLIGVEGCAIGSMEYSHKDRTFARMDSWADPDADWVQPIHHVENISGSKEITSITHDAMLYGRWLHEEHQKAEYLLLSSVDVRRDSVTSGIVVFAGIDIDQNEIKVLF